MTVQGTHRVTEAGKRKDEEAGRPRHIAGAEGGGTLKRQDQTGAIGVSGRMGNRDQAVAEPGAAAL